MEPSSTCGPPGVPRRHERTVFVGALLALWGLFLVQAYLTPVLLDDWYQLTWHRHHEFGLASIWKYAHYNYFHFNPRVGDVFLLIVNGPAAFHFVLTPLVQVGLLWVAFAIALGRWPRATVRDLQLLLVLQVMIWLITPIPGIIYFYRPFATNYLWAFATTLALFAPYRVALARGDDAPRRWLIPLMFGIGWLAGMSNEHTGPTAMVAVAAFVVWAWRTHRLRGWMLAGAAGLYIGYPMLFFAPGQALRYAGMATRNTPLALLAERGFDGCFQILVDFLAEAQYGTNLFVIAALVYVVAIRKRGEPLRTLPRSTLGAASLLTLAAGSIVVTQFASPTVGERLFFAPSVLVAGAFAVLAEHLFTERGARRFLVTACAAIFAYHAYFFVRIYVDVKAENDARLELLRTAAADSVVEVPPYRKQARTRWFWGDDFRYASLREYVANEVYDLRGIEFDRPLRWAQPSPPDRYVATRTFEPPLPPEIAAGVAPVRYIPTYWEWTIVQLRRLLAFTSLGAHQGHRLVRYTVDSVGLGFVDPEQRPVRVLEWTPTALKFVDGRPFDDQFGRPYIRVWDDSVPSGLTESFVVGCGETRPVAPIDDPDGVGPMLPVDFHCRGTYTALMCEPNVCWLAGRYWR